MAEPGGSGRVNAAFGGVFKELSLKTTAPSLFLCPAFHEPNAGAMALLFVGLPCASSCPGQQLYYNSSWHFYPLAFFVSPLSF